MLRILDNLNLINRFDVDASDGLIASGVTGSFVSKQGDTIDLPSAGAAGVMPVWTESYRDGSVGKWTPDVDASGKLTVLYGKFRALTDQFSGNPSVGDQLEVEAAGTLKTLDTGVAVAVCTKASHTVNHLDKDHTVIEIITV